MDASQNLLVLRDGETYKALLELTHEVAFQSDRAQPVIQYALAAMGGAGGVVTLGRGDFVLDGPLDLHDNVWLRGSGRGTRLLVGEQAGDGPGIMGRDIKGAVVSDLALTPLREARVAAGIVLDNAGDCKVRDIAAVGFGDYGVWVRNNAFLCEVRGCSLAGNGKANLFFDHLARGEHGDFIPNLAANCVIYGGGKGIECSRSIVLNIVGCVVYQAGDVAYHVHNTSNSVLISGCRSFQITGHAVLVEDSHEFNLSGNVFCWHTEHGVAVRSCNWGTITGNEVIDSGSYNSGAADTTTKVADLPGDVPLYNGIDLVGVKGFAVSSNAVFNWPVAPHMAIGIREDEKSVRNVITDNNVNYYTEAGVISGGAETEVQGNVCYADEPYQSPQGVGTTAQSFRRELTEAFIRDLLNLGEV